MMKKILIGVLFLISIGGYCQGNIEIKLIYHRVILKETAEYWGGNDYKYFNNSTEGYDKDYRNTLGGTKLESLAKNAYQLALDGK